MTLPAVSVCLCVCAYACVPVCVHAYTMYVMFIRVRRRESVFVCVPLFLYHVCVHNRLTREFVESYTLATVPYKERCINYDVHVLYRMFLLDSSTS